MSDINAPILNIVHYQGNPFNDLLTVYKLILDTSIKVDYQYTSSALRVLRNRFKKRIFVNDGLEILVVGPPPEDIEVIQFDISYSSPFRIRVSSEISLNVRDNTHHRLLERVLGESIATWLRQHRLGGWIVVEDRNAVFEAEKYYEDSSESSLEVWKGFVFTPRIDKYGQASIIIDPKFKIYPTNNLRQQFTEITSEIKSRFREQPLILDSCPFNSCPIRADPYGPCRFIGSGRYVKLVGFDYERKPSEVRIAPSGKNLIEYNESVCPLRLLNDRFVDESPIASVRIGNRTYDYLLERLRLRTDIAFSLLSSASRKRTSMMLQIPPQERFQMTREIWTFISRIELDGMPKLVGGGLVKAGSFEPYDYWEVLHQPNLAVNDMSSIDQTYRTLVEYGPVDFPSGTNPLVREFSEVEVVPVVVAHEYSEKGKNALESLEKYFSSESGMDGFRKVYRMNTTFQTEDFISEPSEIDDLLKKYRKASEDKKRTILYLVVDRAYDNIANTLRRELINSQIPTQTSHIETLQDSRKLAGVFRNLGLSVYAKCGGTPWILADNLEESTLFVGTATLPSRSHDILTVQVYNGVGRWLSGTCREVTKAEYSDTLLQLITEICNQFSEYKRLVIHRGGNVGYEREITPISSAYSDGIIKAQDLTLIELTKSRIRIYTQSGEHYLSAPRGTFVKYQFNSTALLSTSPPRGTPNPIDIRMILGDPNMLQKRTREVFHFSNVYSGYERVITAMPLTIHSCQKALSMANKNQIFVNKFVKIPWFIQD